MKKATSHSTDTELRPDYDFSGGVRGKYARRFAQGTNLVALDPDVAKAFPNSAAVNRSLRALAALVQQQKELLATK